MNINTEGGGGGVSVPTISIYYDEKSCIFLGPKCLQFRGSPLNFAFFLWGILPASRAGGWMYFFKLECPKPFPSPLFVILGKKRRRGLTSGRLEHARGVRTASAGILN